MTTLTRSVALAASLLGALVLAPESADAAGHGGGGSGSGGGSGGGYSGGHGGGGWNGGHGGAWNGGGRGWYGHPGGYWRGGYGYWGRGYWPYWGVGIGLGFGAVGYWGAYPYYGGYYAGYPYYGGYYDAPVAVVDPIYSTVEPNNATRTGQPVPQGGQAPEPIFYPKNGQSAAQTESDRRECNRWATTQNGALTDASIFQRATFACMEGRGYTVR